MVNVAASYSPKHFLLKALSNYQTFQDSFGSSQNLYKKLIKELHTLLCLLVRGLINSKRGVRLFQISQQEKFFSSLITTSGGNILLRPPLTTLQKSPSYLLQFGQEENILGHSFERRHLLICFEVPTGRVETGW